MRSTNLRQWVSIVASHQNHPWHFKKTPRPGATPTGHFSWSMSRPDFFFFQISPGEESSQDRLTIKHLGKAPIFRAFLKFQMSSVLPRPTDHTVTAAIGTSGDSGQGCGTVSCREWQDGFKEAGSETRGLTERLFPLWGSEIIRKFL